ncbi:MAG: tetratricopeptide repeat protein [Chitinophagales bacterium]
MAITQQPDNMNAVLRYTFLILILGLGACKTSRQATAGSPETTKETSKATTEQQAKLDRLYLDAEKAKAIEDYDLALKVFREVLKEDPKNAAAHYEVASLLFGSGKFSEALEEAQQACKLEPSNKWYLDLLANGYLKQANTKEAIKVYEQLIKANPTEPEHYFDLAYLYMQTNQPDLAVKTYDQLEKNYGLEESVVLQKERIYLKQNKFDNAVAEVKKLIDAYPGEVQYLGMLAELYSLNNKKEKASEIYQQILEIEPDNAQALMATADISAAKGDTAARFESMKRIFANPKANIDTKIKMLYPYIQFYEIRKDKYQEAYQLAEILVKTHPDNAKAYSIQGDLYFIDKKETQALECYLKALQLQKDVFSVWQQVMLIYNNQKDWNKLTQVAGEAMELFPNQAVIYLFKGGAEFQQKEYEKALKSYSKGEKMSNDNLQLKAQIFANLGDTYHNLNRNIESDSAYEKALKLDPENAYVLNNYSYYLSLRKTNLERAKQMSAYSNKLDPDNESFMDTYAWILFQLGEYKSALEWQERAMQKSGGNVTLLEHYGDILSQLGQKAKAVEFWKKAKASGASSKQLDEKINTEKYVE